MSLSAMIGGTAALLLQLQPLPVYPDSRLQAIDYRAEHVVPIETAPGYQVTVLLSPDERIESIALGDSGAWQVSATKGGNILFVKLTQPGLATNMTVITDVRLYAFDLVPLGNASGAMPYTLRFDYPKPDTGDEQLPLEILAKYKLSGSRSLWPIAMADDGSKTYIEWASNADLPAVYTLDAAGREVLANGIMRGEYYVIDSVATRLVFRIDNHTAKARRAPVEGGNQ